MSSLVKNVRLRAFDVMNGVMHNDFEFMSVKSADKDFSDGIIFQSDIWEHDFSEWPPKRDFVMKLMVMQCLHAKDVNKKFIFEEDILRVTKKDKEGFWLAVARLGGHGSAVCFDLTNAKKEGLLEYDFLDGKGLSIEVVGNIYENKDTVQDLYDEGVFVEWHRL